MFGEEFHSLGLLHTHVECGNLFFDGTLLEKIGEHVCGIIHTLDVGDGKDSGVLLSKLRPIYYLGYAGNDARGVEIVIQRLAFAQKLREKSRLNCFTPLAAYFT